MRDGHADPDVYKRQLIACEQTDRICYTIELDEKFCDVIVKRYIEQVGSDEKVSVLRDGNCLLYTSRSRTEVYKPRP